MGRAWAVMMSGRGESPSAAVLDPDRGALVSVRPGLAEDIYAGAFDAEVGIADEYMTIERTPQGLAWHVGEMAQKVAYRSLMRDQPTYVVEPGGIREAMTDVEVEQSYGVFLEEVEVGDRVVLRKPGERVGEWEGEEEEEAVEMGAGEGSLYDAGLPGGYGEGF